MAKYLVDIGDGPHRYRCDTPEKETALEFIAWFLHGVRGTAEIDLRFSQEEPNPSQKPLDDAVQRFDAAAGGTATQTAVLP